MNFLLNWGSLCNATVSICHTYIIKRIEDCGHKRKGAVADENTQLCEIAGNARAMLSAERTALNFLQSLSAIATKTRRFVTSTLGTKVKILDTRKTLPGLRMASKYAVHVGGGHNHRIGLFDAALGGDFTACAMSRRNAWCPA